MTDIIDQAKANMAQLMRDGVTINLCYPRGDVRFTAINLLEEAIGRCNAAELNRLLTAGNADEFFSRVYAAREAAIKETCDEEVVDWLAYQAKAKAKVAGKAEKPATAQKSGLVPDGDVRLTANIREDLHLKLKIEAAKRRTTVGELIEQLIERL